MDKMVKENLFNDFYKGRKVSLPGIQALKVRGYQYY